MSGQGWIDPGALPLEELRTRRTQARRAAELARMRGRQPDRPESDELSRLEGVVVVLTEELIARYSGDLSLVDSLLSPAYPARGCQRTEVLA
jgi:hypothetical protein